MIDFHTHLLPSIDDGSSDMDETKELLRMEREQGVEKVVATPHFYAGRDSVEHFLRKREESAERVGQFLREEKGLPRIAVGAEVLYFPGIGKAEVLPELCIKGTRVLLLEMPFCQWDGSVCDDVRTIWEEQEITVVLAHVERYVAYQKRMDEWDEIMAYPLYQQLNAGSFLDWRRRRFPLKCLKEGARVVLGSDCHNIWTRVPNLSEARAYIQKKLGGQVLQQCDSLAENLLEKAFP